MIPNVVEYHLPLQHMAVGIEDEDTPLPEFEIVTSVEGDSEYNSYSIYSDDEPASPQHLNGLGGYVIENHAIESMESLGINATIIGSYTEDLPPQPHSKPNSAPSDIALDLCSFCCLFLLIILCAVLYLIWRPKPEKRKREPVEDNSNFLTADIVKLQADMKCYVHSTVGHYWVDFDLKKVLDSDNLADEISSTLAKSKKLSRSLLNEMIFEEWDKTLDFCLDRIRGDIGFAKRSTAFADAFLQNMQNVGGLKDLSNANECIVDANCKVYSIYQEDHDRLKRDAIEDLVKSLEDKDVRQNREEAHNCFELAVSFSTR